MTEQPADDSRADPASRRDRIPVDPGSSATNGSDVDEATDADDSRYPEPSSTPIRSGSVDPEHAVFVLLGALAMLAVLFWVAEIAL